MVIWILAILIIGFCVWMGWCKGATWAAMAVTGLSVGVFLASSLGLLLRPVFLLTGVTNAIWLWVLPPVTAFLLIQAVAGVIALVVHRRCKLHYKYRMDDVRRFRWERLERRLGACVGLFAGFGYFVLCGLIVYIAGYATVQVAFVDSAPK